MEEGGQHPLDGEDISVTVVMIHRPTFGVGKATVSTNTEDGISVTEVIAKAGQEAMDDLLEQLEARGG